ncbi:MAG: pilus assembly protein HicB, partial [Nocardioides sp.]|nr:pilus assembly protein HicB [Nocardioides sp.]
PAPPSPPSPDEVEDGNVARITLRLPEAVKARAEEFAARSGHSLNTWLVNVVRAATRDDAINVDVDLSSIRMLGDQLSDMFGNKRGERRMTGWL